jgi:hypothetical protein
MAILYESVGASIVIALSTRLTRHSAPYTILVAEKSAIQKILIDDDFKKSPDYEATRQEHDITSLISETDKVKYKQRVSESSDEN